MFLISTIKELYTIYSIYKKINDIIKNHTLVTEEYCQSIKDTILEDGCISIKFAQWLITRLRSEPGEHIEFVVNYFDDIFDNCPYHDIEYTEEVFNSFTNSTLEELTAEDSVTEIASGSVGQIYRAKLKTPYIVCCECDTVIQSGTLQTNTTSKVSLSHDNLILGSLQTSPVHEQCPTCHDPKAPQRKIYDIVIKVKHPEVEEQVRAKIKLFNFLSKLQNIKFIKNLLHLHMDMNGFIENLSLQIDFTNEYNNNRKFRANFKNNRLITFPLALEANRDILISEYIKTEDFETIPDYNQYKQCLNYASMVSQMVVIDNFIHADLHHKNWRIRKIEHCETENAKTENAKTENDYQIVVFDSGICFTSDNTETNKIIWESFESGDIDQIMNIMDKVIIGNYTENIKNQIKPILECYRNTTLNIGHIMNEINNILIHYNCKMSSLCLNIILLLCLIDTTLKKHNLIGTAQPNDCDNQSPTKIHQNSLRTKNLDMIAYLRSKSGCYDNLLTYFEDKQYRLSRTYSGTNLSLFGNNLGNGLVFDIPLD
jgi:predicted unusual protein kinase regulating ubiquinone biosynthesis (AarF/ABC1/UbiB family)